MSTTTPADEAMNRQQTLTNKDVVLRPLVPTDFESLSAIASDPQLREQHPSKDRTQRAVFERWFEGALSSGITLGGRLNSEIKKLGAVRTGSTIDPTAEGATTSFASTNHSTPRSTALMVRDFRLRGLTFHGHA